LGFRVEIDVVVLGFLQEELNEGFRVWGLRAHLETDSLLHFENSKDEILVQPPIQAFQLPW